MLREAKQGRGGGVRLLGPEGQIWEFFFLNEPSLSKHIKQLVQFAFNKPSTPKDKNYYRLQ